MLNKISQINIPTFQHSNNQAFTLIEVSVAIFLITIGVGGAITLVNQTIAFFQVTSSQLVATYLAQEGLEIVKNIRDTNLLKIHKGAGGVNWSDGLLGCALGCEGDYNDSALASSTERYLKIDGGFYNYDSGQESGFKREIFIVPDSDILEVLVKVSWQERGRSYQVSIQENLYKWW